jgi:hypothetical protein
MAVARCDCGSVVSVFPYNLRTGNTRSCGCLHREVTSATNSTHRMSRTAEHSSWSKAKSRCHAPTDAAFADYGGRGIVMCERWRNSFETFLADMGPRPSPKHSIDRIDVNGNYEPGNCRWATAKQQANNTRRTRFVTAFGLTQPPAAWADQCGITRGALTQRLWNGWPIERALAGWSPWGEAFPT